jgi:hypothetical protein
MKLARMLVASALLCPVSTWAQVSVTPLQEFSFPPMEFGFGEAKLAFDQQYMYVSSPAGEVYRVPVSNEAGPLEEILAGPARNALVSSGNALYVLTDSAPVPEGQVPQHSILKSTNHGNTFAPVDAGLLDCELGTCFYLSATELITEGSLIFTNAGGGYNLLVSSNEGNMWKALSGGLFRDICTPPAFEIAGQRVVQGGECPLDQAFLNQGTLARDLVDWAPLGNFKPAVTPYLANRNVNAIKAMPHLPIWFAAAEGAILRSIDNGLSFSFVLERPVGDPISYPYVEHIVFPPLAPTAVVAGGFDKAITRPYLTFSPLLGVGWVNISRFLPGANDEARVSDMAIDPNGKIVVVISDYTTSEVTVARIQPSL